MERLVKDLLRLARLDARQEALEHGAAATSQQIFNAVVADLAPAIEAKRQRVTIDVAPEACTLQADPAKLHDVVRNLVENAVNYSPEDADDPARRRRGATARSRITVADSGPGHPAGRPDARVRAVLPRGQVAVAARRHRPRAGDREASGGAARRQGGGGQPAGRRRGVHHHASRS